jgi:hypothetical protein
MQNVIRSLIASQIESDFMTENETELVKGQMMEMIHQLKKDPTKLPVVYMFPQGRPSHLDAPPSPTHEVTERIPTVVEKSSRFSIMRLGEANEPPPCPPSSASSSAAAAGGNTSGSGGQNTPSSFTPQSTVHSKSRGDSVSATQKDRFAFLSSLFIQFEVYGTAISPYTTVHLFVLIISVIATTRWRHSRSNWRT